MTERTPRTKAANGDGSVYRVKSTGRWRAAFPEKDKATGKTRYTVKTVKTQAEAKKALAEMVREHEVGLDLSQITLEKFLEGWLASQRMRVKASTARAQEGHIRLYINPALGRIQVKKLKATHVERMMSGMVERGLSPLTARHARTTLRRALTTAVRDDIVPRNVAATDVGLPWYERPEVTALTGEEVAKLIAVCAEAGTTYADAIIVAAMTGVRQGELLALGWDDLELEGDEPALNVRKNLARDRDGGWSLLDPKTKKSRRRVDLPARAVAAFRRQKVRQLEMKLRAGMAWHDTGRVFTDELGGFLRGWNLTEAFHLLSMRAGVPTVRFHDLRHSYASILLAAGEPLKVVSESLGHSGIAITADTYGHVVPTQRRRLADALTAETGGAEA